MVEGEGEKLGSGTSCDYGATAVDAPVVAAAPLCVASPAPASVAARTASVDAPAPAGAQAPVVDAVCPVPSKQLAPLSPPSLCAAPAPVEAAAVLTLSPLSPPSLAAAALKALRVDVDAAPMGDENAAVAANLASRYSPTSCPGSCPGSAVSSRHGSPTGDAVEKRRFFAEARAEETAAAVAAAEDHSRLVANLRRGVALKKHGRSGAPKARVLRLSLDGGALVWDSQRRPSLSNVLSPTRAAAAAAEGGNAPADAGVLALRKVTAVAAGHTTAVFRRKNAAPPAHCLSLVSPDRTLDLEFASAAVRDEYLAAFSRLVQQSRA